MKLVLPNPPTFVGWGIRAELISYTSHLLASFNLGRTSGLVKFNGRNSSFDVGLAGSAGNSFFLSVELTEGLVLVSKYK